MAGKEENVGQTPAGEASEENLDRLVDRVAFRLCLDERRRRKRRRFRLLVFGLLALLVVVVGALLWWLSAGQLPDVEILSLR